MWNNILLHSDGSISEYTLRILQNAGKGVAVENAIPSIREIADDITESNNDDGVAKYIEKELEIYGNI